MPKSFHQFENKPLKGPGGLGEAYNGKSEYTEDEVKYSIGVDDDYQKDGLTLLFKKDLNI